MSTSTKPYLLQAIYQWCADNNLTPHIQVHVDPSTHVPRQFVKNDQIVLNISMQAVPDLVIDNYVVYFTARFSGQKERITIPMKNIMAVFAKENNQGIFFGFDEQDVSGEEQTQQVQPVKKEKPKLSIVK